MNNYYVILLLLSLLGLAYGDRSKRLLLFRNPTQTLKMIGIGVGFFLTWDIVGLLLGVFATNQAYVTGLHIITPNLPIEEVLFLILLCYVTLITWRIVCLRTR